MDEEDVAFPIYKRGFQKKKPNPRPAPPFLLGVWAFLRAHARGSFRCDGGDGHPLALDGHPLALDGVRLCIDEAMLLTSVLKATVTLEETASWLPSYVGGVLHKVERVVRLTRLLPIVVMDGDHPPACKSETHAQRATAPFFSTSSRPLTHSQFCETVRKCPL